MSTILDVAARAGVSHATVTRYFRQPNLLAPATYARVKKVVEELNYVPNAAARSLFTGRTDIVSLVVPDIISSFYTNMASGVEEIAREAGFMLALGKTEKHLDRERAYLEALISHRVAGIIFTPGIHSIEHITLLKQHNIPVVLVDRQIDQSGVDMVCGDSFEAGRLLTQHLVDQGYMDIAFVGGDPGVWSLEQRLAGYRSVMEKMELQQQVYLGSYAVESGAEIVQRLVDIQELPAAIFAASSRVVLGVFETLRKNQISVPDDLAVVCVDDVRSASMIDPFLTVVEQPAYEIGRVAMRYLLERIKGSEVTFRTHVLPVDLIVRRSSVVAG